MSKMIYIFCKMKNKRFIKTLLLVVVFIGVLGVFIVPNATEAFVQKHQYSENNLAGLFSGIWHGLLAPYSLIARWFINDVLMYAIPNTGWFYDFGFLVGVAGSVPIGWGAAIISTVAHFFF